MEKKISPVEDLPRDSQSSSPLSNKPLDLPQSFTLVSQLLHIQHLENQYQHLLVLQSYHLHRMNATRDHQLSETYRDIASLMQNVICQYEELLGNLRDI
jgi:hypothetical protein